MPSKMVTRQHLANSSIGAAAISNADDLAARLTETIAEHSQQAEPPQMDWKSVLLDVGQFLVDTGQGLVERDNELQHSRRTERQLRFQRDDSARQIRAQLKSMRYLVDEAFGKERAKLIFPARADLQRVGAPTLLRTAQEAVDTLRGRGVTWPDLSALGHLPTPAQLLAVLEPAIPALASALDGLHPGMRNAVHALGNKDRDFEATVEAMQRGGDFLYGLFRLVGYDVEADRLRIRRRRGRGPAVPEEQPETPAPDAPRVPVAGFPAAQLAS
jgi:hypothetical protein